MYCNNCGKPGHISKDCNQPITSYGVLLFVLEEEPKIIMVQRKDSLCYIELLRGKYNLYDMEKIKLLMNRTSKKEIKNIQTKDFDTLWKELWLIKDVKETKYMKEYIQSKQSFEKLKCHTEINEYLDKNTFNYEDSEWEFPKGKKNKNEKNYECAKRELCEETNIEYEDYDIIQNISPINETFRGENNVNYRNIYYFGICKNTENIKINKENPDQVNEIKDVKIFTRKEAKDHIRDYNSTKFELIDVVFNFIEKYNNDLIIK
tara:strand:- start:291 stop:1076 length:786 start_codon:yes stop_codon:yes gene_type:complete